MKWHFTTAPRCRAMIKFQWRAAAYGKQQPSRRQHNDQCIKGRMHKHHQADQLPLRSFSHRRPRYVQRLGVACSVCPAQYTLHCLPQQEAHSGPPETARVFLGFELDSDLPIFEDVR